MTRFDPDKHRRRSIRLQGYDYTLPGAYFVTIVTHGRELLFEDTVLHRVVETFWQRIPGHTPHVELDEWVVMPNHLHGIIIITDPVGATHSPSDPSMKRPPGPATEIQSEKDQRGNASPPPTGPSPGSLGAIIGNFKSVTTRRINRVRHSPGLRVWQRNYYERIIRNERELNAIRQYIHDNPSRWADDEENPARIKAT